MAKVDSSLIDSVNSSYGRVAVKSEFFDEFYDVFLNCDPRIKPMFANTDLEKQKKLLRQGISYMIMYVKDSHAGESAIKRIAEIHDRNHHSTAPELYPLWINSLLSTVKKFDPQYSDELEKSWRTVLEPGISFFTSKY